MRRGERWWFQLMFDRPERRRVFILPYWSIRLPALLTASIMRHAAQVAADRLKIND